MAANEEARQRMGTVLVVEDTPAIGDLVHTVLTDEGYAVSLLTSVTDGAIRAAVGRLEPDCVLLDSAGHGDYEPAWLSAVWAHTRERPVPVVMFTAGTEAVREAAAGESARSAAIHAVVAKPFDLDVLLDAVADAVGSVPRFDRSAVGEARRTDALVAQLQAAGARDVRASARREWASCYAGPVGGPGDDVLTLVYWSPRDGVYYVLRQPQDTGALRQVGRFHDLAAAVAVVVAPGRA